MASLSWTRRRINNRTITASILPMSVRAPDSKGLTGIVMNFKSLSAKWQFIPRIHTSIYIGHPPSSQAPVFSLYFIFLWNSVDPCRPNSLNHLIFKTNDNSVLCSCVCVCGLLNWNGFQLKLNCLLCLNNDINISEKARPVSVKWESDFRVAICVILPAF